MHGQAKNNMRRGHGQAKNNMCSSLQQEKNSPKNPNMNLILSSSVSYKSSKKLASGGGGEVLETSNYSHSPISQ